MIALRRIARVRYGLGQPPSRAEQGIPIIRATNIHRGRILERDLIYARLDDLPLDRAPLLEEGEILLVRSGAYTGDSAIVTSRWTGAAPGYDLRITPESVLPRFLAWTLLSKLVAHQVRLAMLRAAQPHLNAEDVGSLVVPSLGESRQRRIADFLDRETERIDALIDKKRRLIDLLEEKRTATITHAVTKGLDATVPMKDSGIPWIGEIPAHWGVAQIRRVVSSISDGPFGSSLTSSHYADSGARVVRLGNIGDGVFLDTDEAFVSMEYFGELSRHALRPGDLVMAGLGDAERGLGRVAEITAAALPAIHKADCFRVRINESHVNRRFFAEFCSSSAGVEGANAHSQGTTRMRINTSIVRSLPIPVPPIGEQVMIAGGAEQVRRATGKAWERITTQLALLLEYREALITAAVTGEIDVDTFDAERNLEEATP